jgi:hypothetical protein
MWFVSVVTNVLWAGVAAYGIWRWAQVAEQFAPVPADPIEAPVAIKDIPEDLMALAMTERESWAQEELVRVIQERYDTLKDWNRVRSSMGVGIINEAV